MKALSPKRTLRRSASPAVASLATVLRYRNRRVIRSFLLHYDLPEAEAAALFQDVLRFLWLCASENRPLLILDSQLLFDEMWHTFILHTRAYEAFCLRHFGRVMHHLPADASRRGRVLSASQRRLADAQVDDTVACVFDRLGEQVADRWYRQHARRYTPRFIERCRVPLSAR